MSDQTPQPSPLSQAMALLDRAAQQFRKYETSHRDKAERWKDDQARAAIERTPGPTNEQIEDTIAKAEVNAAIAAEIEAFLMPPADLAELGDPRTPSEHLHGDAVRLGTMQVTTPRGPIWTNDAPGVMTTIIDAPGGYRRVGVLVYDPETVPGQPYGIGMIHQLDGDGARSMAASLCRLADLTDQRKPN